MRNEPDKAFKRMGIACPVSHEERHSAKGLFEVFAEVLHELTVIGAASEAKHPSAADWLRTGANDISAIVLCRCSAQELPERPVLLVLMLQERPEPLERRKLLPAQLDLRGPA